MPSTPPATSRTPRVLTARRARAVATRLVAAFVFQCPFAAAQHFDASQDSPTPSAATRAVDSRPAAAPAEPRADDLFSIGCASLYDKRLDDAIRALGQAARMRPAEGRFALKLAEALRAANRVEDAVRTLDACLVVSPNDDDVAMALAGLHVDQLNWKECEAVLRPRWMRIEGSGLALLTRAMHRQGRTRDAEAVLERRLERALGGREETAWLLYAELALEAGNPAQTLDRIERARSRRAESPRLAFLAARAHLLMGRPLGSPEIREMPDAEVGRIHGQWLPIEKVADPDRYLCCPESSALYEVHRALAAGLGLPETHVLHARILLAASRPRDAWRVLQAQEKTLLECKLSEAEDLLAEVALVVGAIDDYLRYAGLRAERRPAQRDEILFAAHRDAAHRCAQRGDSEAHQRQLRYALEIRPKSPVLMVELGDALWESREQAQAQEWYRKALEADPATPERLRLFERLSMTVASQPASSPSHEP